MQQLLISLTDLLLFQLVVLGMKNHPATLNVQLAASACVFNLTKQDLAAGMPVRLLSTVTQLLLEAMRTFPNHQQVASSRGVRCKKQLSGSALMPLLVFSFHSCRKIACCLSAAIASYKKFHSTGNRFSFTISACNTEGCKGGKES